MILPLKKSSSLKNIHKQNTASSLKSILPKIPFVLNSYHVFTKPLPLLDNKRLQITNECSCISLLIVTCSQAVKSHGLLIMPDPQMEVCGAIKFRTLPVSFLISEWVMPYICRAEPRFLFLRASIDRRADVNSDCAAHHNFGRISRLGAKFYAKAVGTSRSLLLELAPAKSGLGFDYFFFYIRYTWEVWVSLSTDSLCACPFACVCDSKVSFSREQGGCFRGYCQNITTWCTQLVVMYKSLLQLKGSLLTARLALRLNGLTAKQLHCAGKRIGWFKWGH